MVCYAEQPTWGKCELCEKFRPLRDRLCPRCRQLAEWLDQDPPAEHPGWDRLLGDLR